MSVVKAYLVSTSAGHTERAIANANGEVYTPELGWHVPAVTVQVITVGGEYGNWADVPFVWLGQVPYWRAGSSVGVNS